MEEEKSKRDLFLDALNACIEGEYNAPGKPEFVEQVDKKLVQKNIQETIDNFKSNSKMTVKEIIQYLLDKIKVRRGINPKVKEEYDVLEEILYDMLGQEGEIDL